ncbi:hypothetical protein ACKWTF_002857 [Chironomus riparius]
MKSFALLLVVGFTLVYGQFDPHWRAGRSVMVHLFEWKWNDIANECETFLGPRGYAGVQISPPAENVIIRTPSRPWWERYQPVSYSLNTRSGNEATFADMTRRCNAVGVRIYVDLLLNHMSATTGTGTGGTIVSTPRNFPAVPYVDADFNPTCSIDWGSATSVRNCELVGLPDLDQSRSNVRQHLINYMNRLIDLGVAGFRQDALKHMWPGDLQVMFSQLHNLNTNHGFAANSRAYMVGEVIDNGNEPISGTEYFGFSTITEFRYSNAISNSFRGNDQLRWLRNFGEAWGFHPSNRVLTFVENHDNERGGALSYKSARQYKMAVAFHLAWNYGIPRIMSSFAFEGHDMGPPMDANENLLSPLFDAAGACTNGWICQHRWRQIFHMVEWRNVVGTGAVANWWDNANNRIAFSRGSRGFIAFNGESSNMSEWLTTGLSAGVYCEYKHFKAKRSLTNDLF